MNKNLIALFAQPGMSFHQEITGDLYDKSSSDANIILFHCKNNDTRARRAQVDEVKANGQYKLIVTIGHHATVTILERCKELGLNIPIIYADIGPPSELSSLKKEYPITGVGKKHVSSEMSARIFHLLKPSMRHIIIPYEEQPDKRLEKHAATVKKHFAKNNITVTLIPFKRLSEETLETIKRTALEKNADSLMYLEGCLCEGMMRALGSLCKRINLSYFAPTLGALEHNATAVFAGSCNNMADEIVVLAKKILHDGLDPKELTPATVRDNRGLIINTQQALLPTSSVPKALLYCLNGTIVYEQ